MDVPYITNEVCLLSLRVELCHPVWGSLLIYSLKVLNSTSATLMDTIGYCLRVFCALLENIKFYLHISPHVFFSPLILFVVDWWALYQKGNKANTAHSSCVQSKYCPVQFNRPAINRTFYGPLSFVTFSCWHRHSGVIAAILR